MTEFELEGIFPAIPTPRYSSDDVLNPGEIDYEAQEKHVEYLEDGGVQGLTVAGCTGMPSAMPHEEHVEYVQRVADMTDLPVIAGTATNDTRETYQLASEIEEVADIDAHLMITPYKVKAEPEGVERHYEALADELEQPIVLYDVPSRTGRQMDVDTVVNLAEHENILGIKDATGDQEYIQRIDGRLEMNDVNTFSIVSGDDPNSHYVYELENGTGTISVTGNVDPGSVIDVWEQGYVEENYEEARRMNAELTGTEEEPGLHKAMFLESNPGPVHAALGMAVHSSYDNVASPLSPLQEENRQQLEGVLERYDIVAAETAEAA